MSGDQGSEEKSLPPSLKKLRQAREKGQIAKSVDAVSAATVTMLTLYLILAWPSIQEQFARMFDVAGRAAMRGGPSSWEAALRETADAGTAILIPIYLIGIAATIIGAIISNKGVVFSFHPLKPDLKRIHPAEGFKKIFSLRNGVEFLKALVKSFLLMGALGLSAWYGLGAILRIPHCGAGCTGEALVAVAGPLIILALLLFLLAALIDSNIQKWLFTRDMRMTHSEQKREMKETYGDPQIRGARKEQQRADARGDSGKASKFLKSRAPTVVICSGNDVAIALRYVAGETPAPILLAKATGARASMLIASAVNSGIHVANDPETASALLQQGRIDGFVPESLFRDVARVMNSA